MEDNKHFTAKLPTGDSGMIPITTNFDGRPVGRIDKINDDGTFIGVITDPDTAAVLAKGCLAAVSIQFTAYVAASEADLPSGVDSSVVSALQLRHPAFDE